MPTLPESPVFRLYVLCCTILSLLMLTLAAMTAARRARKQGYLNPEDARIAFKDARLVDGAEHPETARIVRAHRNLNESLPMFFALGLACALSGASVVASEVLIGVFTGARVLHAIVYLKELQPWRTMMYAVGSLALVGMMVVSLMAVFA